MTEKNEANAGELNLGECREQGGQLETELRNTVLDRCLVFITSLAFCLILIFVIAQVLVRYFVVHLGVSLPWTEEAARYLLIIVTFFGAAVACRKREHITITSLVECLPAKVTTILDLCSTLLILLFLAVAIVGAYSFTIKMIGAPVGAISWLKLGHLYGALTLGLILIAVYQLRWLVSNIKQTKRIFSGKGAGKL